MGLTRKLMIEMRNRVEGREEKNHRIFEFFMELLPEETEKVFIYVGAGSEVSTAAIRGELLARGIKLFCPKVVDGNVYFFPVLSPSDLKSGYHKIPEPDVEEEGRDIQEIIEEKSVTPTDTPDCLMVMPGVVFDEQGGRLGYGAGMYDRYLQKHPCRKVALAFEVQVRKKPLPLKPTDVPVDILVTEDRILRFDEV